METVIKNTLKQIEKEYNIRILLAIESGSRAWGFPSPDSDFDVRFIYVRPLDWYISIQDKKDTIDFPVNGELDLGGWDIKKSLELLRKSNAPLLEWLQSPIVYYAEPGFKEAFQELANGYYSPIATMYHYLSMAKKYKSMITEDGDNVKLKRYFYALRAAFAGYWIRENGSIPPIQFPEMLGLIEDNSIRLEIQELIALKSTKDENYIHPKNQGLDMLIDTLIQKNELSAPDLCAGKGDDFQLDTFLRMVIKGGY